MRARIDKALPVSAKVPHHNKFTNAFSNYPPTEERIEKAQYEIAKLLPRRNDYIIDTSEFQEVKAKLAWADRPILRRHREGDGPSNGPVLHRQTQPYDLAGTSHVITKDRLPLSSVTCPRFRTEFHYTQHLGFSITAHSRVRLFLWYAESLDRKEVQFQYLGVPVDA